MEDIYIHMYYIYKYLAEKLVNLAQIKAMTAIS